MKARAYTKDLSFYQQKISDKLGWKCKSLKMVKSEKVMVRWNPLEKEDKITKMKKE